MSLLRHLLDVFNLPSTGRAEREYSIVCGIRRDLDDREFYDAYYSDTGISADTTNRVRSVLRSQLNMSNIRPDDDVANIFADVDFWEICREIGEEFGLNFTDEIVQSMNGTVDAIICAIEKSRKESLGDSRMAT
jgi:acyl carrier protein